MTLKEIEKHFRLEKYREDSSQYLIFSNVPKSCSRMVYKYLCLIQRHGQKFCVNGFEPTNNVLELKEQIQNYVSSLSYDSMYDNPHFIKGLREELMVHDYMDELGFQIPMYRTSYVLKTKNIYGYTANNISLSFYGLDRFHKYRENGLVDSLCAEVDISIHTGEYSWISVTVSRDIESLKAGIDSLLKPLMVSESVNLFDTADKMNNDSMDMDFLLQSLTNSLDLNSSDYKAELKRKLIELAEKID